MPHSKDADFSDFRREYDIQQVGDLEYFPKFVQLETVSGCNARCTMCSVESWERRVARMPEALFRRLASEMEEHADWIEQVAVHMGGEPLLDKQLEEKIRLLKSARIKSVVFTTNASLLTEERSRRILEAGIDGVDFSVDGYSANTFEGIRVNLAHDVVLKNILKFLAVRDELGTATTVRIRMVLQKQNAREFENFVGFWRSQIRRNDYVLGKILNWWTDWEDELGQSLAGYLVRKAVPSNEFINGLPCLAPSSSLVVLSDGRVPLCCLDYNADTEMGDVNNETMKQVWQGESFHRARLAHRTSGRMGMSFCKDCHTFVSEVGFEFSGLL